MGAYYNLSMFEQMRLAILLQKVNKLDANALNHNCAFKMATNARSIGLEKDIGALAKGKKADITILDRNSLGFRMYFVLQIHN